LFDFQTESYASMFAAILLFIFAFPIFLYYCYARPKYADLLRVSFALIVCNVFIILFLLIPNNKRGISLLKNIDYSSIASVFSKTEPKKNSSSSPRYVTNNDPILLEGNTSGSNKSSGADIICSDCGVNISGQEPDFSPPLVSFMWPVQGKIIKSFHYPENDGVNIAVPFGTEVKAVDAGMVVYAGKEIHSYGRLILIRHDNGYVSTYAHNSQLMVEKGDRIYSGQIIAKSGQSGNVASPQLLFELRKGAIPVNPLKFLPSNRKIIGSR